VEAEKRTEKRLAEKEKRGLYLLMAQDLGEESPPADRDMGESDTLEQGNGPIDVELRIASLGDYL